MWRVLKIYQTGFILFRLNSVEGGRVPQGMRSVSYYMYVCNDATLEKKMETQATNLKSSVPHRISEMEESMHFI